MSVAGDRVDDAPYVEFESESQFAPAARNVADLAAREVLRYRELFSDLRSTAAYLDTRQDGLNPHDDALNAGVGWSLLGEMKRAARSFDRADAIIERYWDDWARAVSLRSDEERAHARKEGVFYPEPAEGPSLRARLDEDHARVERFRLLLSDPTVFRAEVTAAATSVRQQLKLPQIQLQL